MLARIAGSHISDKPIRIYIHKLWWISHWMTFDIPSAYGIWNGPQSYAQIHCCFSSSFFLPFVRLSGLRLTENGSHRLVGWQLNSMKKQKWTALKSDILLYGIYTYQWQTNDKCLDLWGRIFYCPLSIVHCQRKLQNEWWRTEKVNSLNEEKIKSNFRTLIKWIFQNILEPVAYTAKKKTLLNLLINSNLRKCRRDDSAFLHSQRDSAEFCAVYTDRK